MKSRRPSSREKQPAHEVVHGSHAAITKKKNMSQDSRNLRIIAIIVIVLVVGGFVALWISFRPAPSVVQVPATQAPTGNPVLEVAGNQLPAMFPPDIPMESGAVVTSNFNSAAANGQLQATRSFQSAKSVADNFALYQKFLTSKAAIWTIVSEVNNASNQNSKSIFAKNSTGFMTISMTNLPPQPLPATLVTITFTTKPAPVPGQ